MLPSLDLMRFEALETEELEDQRKILLARRYHEGLQDVYLSARALEYLGLHAENKFRLNICKTIVTAVLDELNLIGFDTGEQGDVKPLSEFATKVLTDNRVDELQKSVHLCALRDRESFVIVDWIKTPEGGRPRLTWMPRYTSLTNETLAGDEMGVVMVYPDDDFSQPAIAAIKRWVETVQEGMALKQRMRKTIYYPDRIERYFYGSGWQHYTDKEDETWPIPWVDDKNQPLGIPVFHFKNADLSPEAWDAIPLQDAINKLLVDVLGTADTTGFAIFFTSGFIPTVDGLPLKADQSNAATVAPGSLVGTTKENADMKKLSGESPVPLLDAMTQIVMFAAHITSTPPSRFRDGSQVASGDSQKETSKPFNSKLNDRRVLFGNAWENVMSMARKLANLWGNANLDPEVPFSALWKYSFSMDELVQKKSLGVPQEQIWKEMGYTAQEIEAMKNMDEYKLKVDSQKASLETARSMSRQPGR